MITRQELDALLLIIQRAPMNQAEILSVNAIIEKLALEIQKQESDKNEE